MIELPPSSVLTLAPDINVRDAVKRIDQAQTQFALIVASHLIGIFTERNLFQAVASGLELATLPISAVMTPSPIVIHQAEVKNLAFILHQFQQHQLQYLPVVNDQNQPVGVISLHNALAQLQNQEAFNEPEQLSSETSFRILATNIPGAIYRCTPASGWQDVFINEAIETIVGYPASDFVINGPRCFTDIIHPEDLPRVEQAVEEALQQRRSFRLEYRIVHADSSIRWVDERGQGIFDQQGNVLWLDGVIFDITDRKQIEEALQETTKQFCEIADTIRQFFFIRSASGEYLYVSPAYEKIWGRSCASLYQDPHSWLETIHPDDRSSVMGSLAQQWQGDSVSREYRIVRADGAIRWIRADISLIKDADGNLLRFVGAAEDITDRKLSEEKLRESQHFIQSITDASPNLLYLFDLVEQRNVYVNREVSQVLGYTPEEIQAMGNQLLQNLMHPDDFVDRNEHLQHLMVAQDGEILEFEYRMRHKTGEWRWLYSHEILFLRTAEGMPQQVLGTAVDITDRKQAEHQIRFQAELLDTVEQAAIAIDLTGRITYWNRYAEALYGWSKTEAIGQNITLVLPETNREQAAQIALHMKTGRSWTSEFEVRRKDGTTFIAMILGSPICDEQGNLIGIIGVLSDITERKQMEVALQQSEQRYRAIVEDQTEFIVRYQTNSIVTFANEAFCRYFRLLREEIIGRTYQPVIVPDDRAYVAQLISTLNAENPVITVENRVIAGDGTVRWTQWINRVILDEQNQITEVQSVGRDITELKQIETELRDSEEKFRQLASHIKDVFWMFSSQDASLLYISPVFEQIWGRSCEMVYGNPYAFIDFIHPDEQQHIRDAIAKRDREGGAIDLEYRIIKPNGEIRWIHDRGFPICNESGQIYRIVGIASDITDRKQAEEALQQAKEAAESANRAKSEFLSRMSHELRTPLTSVLGFADLIAKDTSLSTEHQENLTIIRRSGTYLLNLINSVLEMSRIEAGELTLNETSFDLYHLLESIKQLFQLKATSKGLDLCVTWDIDLPQYIQTDENKLRQVLLNLLDNAIKYTEQGRIVLKVSWEQTNQEQETEDREQSAERSQEFATNLSSLSHLSLSSPIDPPLHPPTHPPIHLRFQVKDTGIGIAAEEQSILFDAFVQTEAGRKLQQGTGLGLAISRQFVQMMGGDITVESQLGQGTTLTFVIQTKVSETSFNLSPALVQRSVIGLTTSAIYRVLVVDDQTETRKILVKMLEPIGFEVREATNGQDAVELWEQWHPHLIWMDMQMPVMNGYEATQQIRAREREWADEAPTQIIALTASVFDQQRSSALAVGCDDVVTKPFQQANILEKMAEHLELQYRWTEPLCKDEAVLPTVQASLSSLPPSLLQTLPETWSADLYHASLRLNSNQCLKLIEQLPETHDLLAQILTDLVNQFQFDTIVEWLELSLGPIKFGYEDLTLESG